MTDLREAIAIELGFFDSDSVYYDTAAEYWQDALQVDRDTALAKADAVLALLPSLVVKPLEWEERIRSDKWPEWRRYVSGDYAVANRGTDYWRFFYQFSAPTDQIFFEPEDAQAAANAHHATQVMAMLTVGEG